MALVLGKRHLGDPLEEQYEGPEDKKATREEMKERYVKNLKQINTIPHPFLIPLS